jgi:hypothetical protein
MGCSRSAKEALVPDGNRVITKLGEQLSRALIEKAAAEAERDEAVEALQNQQSSGDKSHSQKYRQAGIGDTDDGTEQQPQ